MKTTKNQLSARQIEVLKGFQIDAFDDEFQIVGNRLFDDDHLDECEPCLEITPKVVPRVNPGSRAWNGTVLSIILIKLTMLYILRKRFPATNRFGCNSTKAKTVRVNEETQSTQSDQCPQEKTVIAISSKPESLASDKEAAKSDLPPDLTNEFETISGSIAFFEKGDYGNDSSSTMLSHRMLTVASTNSINQMSYAEAVKSEFRDEVLSIAKIYEQVLHESGYQQNDPILAMVSLQAAIAKRNTESLCNANLLAEIRGYHYHMKQKTLDRKLSQTQHEEILASAREEKDWKLRLRRSRNDCLAALKASFARSVLFALAVAPLRRIFDLHQKLHGYSYLYLASQAVSKIATCTKTDEGVSLKSSSSSGLKLNVVDAVLFLLPSKAQGFVEVSSCMAYNSAALLFSLILLLLSAIFARALRLPLLTSISVIAVSFSSHWISMVRVLNVVAITSSCSVIAIICILVINRVALFKLRKLKFVSADRLDTFNIIFERLKWLIQLLPLLVFGLCQLVDSN